MKGYLGEFDVDIATTKFSGFGAGDWAMWFIESYGQIDGAHHKQWVLDQVARIHKGARVIVKEARWDNGHTEYRVRLEASQAYHDWVVAMESGDEGPHTYEYDAGSPP